MGIASIAGGIVAIYFRRASLDEATIMASLTTILVGIGLIVAKDNDVTGGTKQQ